MYISKYIDSHMNYDITHITVYSPSVTIFVFIVSDTLNSWNRKNLTAGHRFDVK